MASWDTSATISTFLTHDDIQKAAANLDQEHQTPVLKLVAEARSKGYDVICIPLTTENWKKRWEGMCLVPSEADRDAAVCAGQRAEAEAWRSGPGFLQDEVTITRLGE